MTFMLSLHKKIIDTLIQKIPPEDNLADVISRLLSLNKPAVYRRIDGKVPFTFKEMSVLSHVLGISLDEIVQTLPKKSCVLNMVAHDHLNCLESSYTEIQNYIDALKWLKTSPESKVEQITNLIPCSLYMPYEHISRFLLFKWIYQYGYFERGIPYKEVHIKEKYRELQLAYLKEIRTASSTSIIMDPLTFYYRVNDLNYFTDLNLITKEELLLIQQDFYDLLDEMEWSCLNGTFKDTGKPLYIYIGITNFDTNYCYIHANQMYLSLVKVFLLNDLSTTIRKTFEQFQQWIQSLKRYTTLITQSGEKQRMIYFDYQRRIIESLTNKDIHIEDFLFELDYFKE